MTKVRVAVIVDKGFIRKWQLQSIINAADLIDIKLILSCQNSVGRKVRPDNLFYYGFSYVFARCADRAYVPVPDDWVNMAKFDSSIDGMWQSLPSSVIDLVKSQEINLILKFGMGLLRIPNELSDVPILSFHHGDPARYRGRPAVFYEMLNNEKYIGIIVQRLTNRVDSGAVLAFAEAQVVPYSYRKTVNHVYAASKYLLKQAIVSHNGNKTIPLVPTKKIYKIPDNGTVVRLAFGLGIRIFKRMLIASFYERYWQVAVSSQVVNFHTENKLSLRDSHILPESKEYSFLADPFFCPRGKFLRFEGMSKRTGLGELVQTPVLRPEDIRVVIKGVHLSYPMSYIQNNVEYLMPEMSNFCGQKKFIVEDGNISRSLVVHEFDGMAIKDPTIFHYRGATYCFFSEGRTANFVLHLWVDEAQSGEFKLHPASPICISPGNARMGGNIVRNGDSLYRFGQRCRDIYGESLAIMQIEVLSPTQYSESQVGSIVTDQGLGPHTLNFHWSTGQIAFDFFTYKFNIFAWISKLNGVIRSVTNRERRLKFGTCNE